MNWQGTDLEDITYTMATCITCYAVHVAVIGFCYYKVLNVNHFIVGLYVSVRF